jgi:pyruvate/2-oxoglutarate dehydrogenase complex dihydrolipoamide acyltransferase (E2) component
MKEGSIKVKAGQKVVAGTVLGIMATTGDSTGKHLHWEIWQGKTHGWSNNGKGFVSPLDFAEGLMKAEAAIAAGPKATAEDAPVAPEATHSAKKPVAKKAVAKPVAAPATKSVAKPVAVAKATETI